MARADAHVRRSTGWAFALVATALFAGAPGSASVTGVCPDGSMFIVQRAESVPCRDAKAVEPSEVPPMKPEYLPRPYGWQVFHRRNDPNNPYNLIQEPPRDSEPLGRTREGPNAPRRAPERPEGPHLAPRGASRAPEPAPPVGSGGQMAGPALPLADTEIADLAMIVELSQRVAPAAFSDDGSGARVRLARSLAFEARLREHLAGRSRANRGPVVLFVADAASQGAFYGNLTFVQNGIAFHPSSDDPDQLGVIRGALGPLANGSSVLGYVVLPERLDPSHPMDVYWNDRQLTAIFQH